MSQTTERNTVISTGSSCARVSFCANLKDTAFPVVSFFTYFRFCARFYSYYYRSATFQNVTQSS